MKKKTLVITLILACCGISAQAQTLTTNDTGIANLGISDTAAAPGQSAQGAPATPQAPVPAPTAHKSIAKTVLLGLFIPGGGNFYTGEKAKGAIVLATAIAGDALALSSVN